MTGRRWAPLAVVILALGQACSKGDGAASRTSGVTSATAGPETGKPSTPAATDTTEFIERKLAEDQLARSPELKVGAARCPDGAPTGKPGASVVCTLEVEGVDVPIRVTLLAGGNYQFSAAKPMVDVVRLAMGLRNQAAAQMKVPPERVKVDCGSAKVQVLDVGGKIQCTLDDGHTKRHLVAVVTDVNGAISTTET